MLEHKSTTHSASELFELIKSRTTDWQNFTINEESIRDALTNYPEFQIAEDESLLFLSKVVVESGISKLSLTYIHYDSEKELKALLIYLEKMFEK